MNHPPPPFSGNCEQFSPCWCAVAGRENNPHCKLGVSINNPYFIVFMIVAGSFLILHKLKIINMKTLFNRFYDQVSTFLFGAKSFKWGELKGL